MAAHEKPAKRQLVFGHEVGDTPWEASHQIGLTSMELGHGNSAQIVNLIGCEIVSGAFKPETRLPNEASMREKYSVSRTALREAYSKLTAKGLIRARPKIGTHVRPQSDWNMLDSDVLSWHLHTMPPQAIARDLYTLRRMVEPSAAALAAEVHTEDGLAKIVDAYADMEACQSGSNKLIEADSRFHLAILAATGNHFIGAFSALIQAAMLSTFRLSWRGAQNIRVDRLLQHKDVLDAITARDSSLASKSMERLLDDSINDVQEGLEV